MRKSKYIIISIGLVLLLIGLYLANSSVSQIKQADSQMESNIGSKVIFNKDTLNVINYSILNETYTLSNGTIINYKLLDKIKLK